MRLTLRTLLAYLDDVLPPSETKELGKRISESDSASELVARIKEVLKRRRIEAPAVTDAPDPNAVAEYLDNLLTADATADHERTCLTSDAVLAETAATHQVLALVLGQPVNVPEETRAGLYELAPQSATKGSDSAVKPVVKPPVPPPVRGEITAEMEVVRQAEASRRWPRLAAAAAALAACVALFAFVWQSDDALTGGQRPVAAVDAGDGNQVVAEPPVPLPPPAESGEPAEPPVGGPAVAMAEGPTAVVDASGDSAGLPDSVTEVPPSPTPAAEDATEPTGDAAMVEEAATEEAATAAEEATPKAEAFVFRFEEGSLLFSPNDDAGGWARVPAGTEIRPGREVVVPPTFDATLTVSGGPEDAAAEIVLNNARAVLLGPDETTGGGVRLEAGRLAVRNRGEETVSVRLDAGKRVTAELGEGGELLLSVRPDLPMRIGDVPAGVDSILALTGGIVTAGPLSRGADSEAVVGPLAGDAVDADALVEWAGRDEGSTLTRRYRAMFLKLLPDEGAVGEVLPAVLNEPVYRMSELAAESLALLGDGEALVAGLSSDHEETRRASIEGLRAWIAEDPSRFDSMRSQLRVRFREETADRIARLVRGLPNEELRTRSVSDRLLEDLLDDEIALRETAYAVIRRQVARRFDYRPNAGVQSRGVAVRRWRDYVEDEGALLQPVIAEEAVVEEPLE